MKLRAVPCRCRKCCQTLLGEELSGQLHRHLPKAARCVPASRCAGDQSRGSSPATSAADHQPSAPQPPQPVPSAPPTARAAEPRFPPRAQHALFWCNRTL